ncbi:GNAT family N-acetyltransferase [Parachitinimonas caeni]|uniref:GNAT family N-acetyltransferase n=1 Tax=Parachitinimonas caeni TaxID=3031301 RepID=A0ABT7DXK7_9NEIS|nr:GNAT family N-acetyltransferase [Parachitinimonas caeni]MDK2124766.1 GNAT family N-acetyltransferase [Parachitinimonas caeni]
MTPIAQTPHLLLRHWQEADLDAFCRLTSDPLVMHWVGDGTVLDRDITARWIAKSQQNYLQRGYGVWAVQDRLSEEVIGWAGITQTEHSEEGRSAELVYALRPDYWGKGHASELVLQITGWTWRHTALDSIVATIDPANTPSQRVLEKNGFAVEADRLDEDGLPVRYCRLYRS